MTERRTQAQRTAATKAALIDATIETIADLGYHRASLGEICARAGVSKGGLFRHFDSRLDLVVAAAEEVGQRHLAGVHDLGDVPIADLLAFARSRARERINAVWFELLIAARTDTALREQLTPVALNLYDRIEEIALAANPWSGVDPELTTLAVTSMVHMFDGEAVIRAVLPRPELEEARLAGVTRLFETVAAPGSPTR